MGLMVSGGCHSSKPNNPYTNKSSGEIHISINENILSPDRKKIVRECRQWIGTPYKYGGNTHEEGVDCSGMVLMVYLNALDRKLPRNSLAQSEFCKKLRSVDVKPGDLVFFATGKNPDRISHVGIMLDTDSFIHSSSTKGVVISQLTLPYWTKTFRMFGRVPGVN
ncbi:MAG: C40 family peptidase [Muribaculaceae bacterium]|nr:C40 family peptidase [Muribaculaceae bacterium]